MKPKMKILSIMLLTLILIPFISAADWDNVKSYDAATKTITIKDSVLGIPTTTVATARLITPHVNYVMPGPDRKVAEIEIDLSDDTYTNALKDMEFYDLTAKGEKVTREFKYKTKSVKIKTLKHSYCPVDEGKMSFKESITYCEDKKNQIETTSEVEEVTWVNLNSKDLIKGKVTIGIFTDVLPGDYVEWVPTLFGVKIQEWAVWTDGLNVQLLGYWPFEENTGTLVVNKIGRPNGTVGTGPQWQNNGGIIGHCLNYSDNGGGVTFTNDQVYNLAGAYRNFTVNYWIKSADTSGDWHGTFSRDGQVALGYDNDGRMRWYSRAPDTGWHYGNANTINNNTWHMVTWSYLTAGYMSVYIDGIIDVDTTTTTYATCTACQTEFGATSGATEWTNGNLDELGIWNRTLTTDEITQLYNSGYAITYTDSPAGVTVIYPTNTTYSTHRVAMNYTSTKAVACWYSLDLGATNYSVVCGENITGITSTEGANVWTMYINDSTPTIFSSKVYFNVDTTAPVVNVFNPVNWALYTNISGIGFNFSASDTGIQKCFYTMNEGLTNTTLANCTSNITLTLPVYGKDIVFKFSANDTAGNQGNYYVNVTGVNMTHLFDTPVYELETKNYMMVLNMSNNVNIVSSIFTFNGTNYTTGIAVNGKTYNATLAIPFQSDSAQKNFSWFFTATYGGLTKYLVSPVQNQSVFQVLLNQCGWKTASHTFSQQIMNFTFYDEITLERLNATLDSSSWTYSVSGSLVSNRTLTVANSTHNREYGMCVNPNSTASITASSQLQYSSSDSGTYPQRRYNILSMPFTNASVTAYSLPLLNTNNGVTTTYQVVTVGNQVIQNAYIKVQRTIGGTVTTIADGYTDSSGTIAFFLSPNYEHQLTVIASGYSTQYLTVTPTSGTYTITMGSAANYFQFNSNVEGLTWTKFPPSGTLRRGYYNFSYIAHSTTANVYNCYFYIYYPNGSLLAASNDGCNQTATPNTGGLAWVFVNWTGSDRYIYGKYYINITNNTLVQVEGDAKWVYINITSNAYWTSMRSALNESIYLPEWGSESQVADFSRIVFFFLFMAIILAAINFYTSYDTAHPGILIYLITFIVIIMSGINGITGRGFFYLEGAVNNTFFMGMGSIINNWILAANFFMLSATYFFTINRRQNG